MAKSLRSKRKRKMRAIKRIRYGEKEMARLQNMIEKSNSKSSDSSIPSFNPRQLAGTKFVKVSLTQKNEEKEDKIDEMEIDSGVKRSSKTLRDQFGQYPVWMNSRQIKKHKNKLKLKRIQSKKK